MPARSVEPAGAVERRLKSLEFDGLESHFEGILALSAPRAAYGSVLGRLDAALRGDPGSARLWALKGKALANLGRRAGARAALERSLRLDGGRADARAWLSGVHLGAGLFADARAEAGRALALDPACGWAAFYLAVALHALGDRAAAGKSLARLARAAHPAASAARAFRALLAAREGRYAAALEDLRRVRAAAPGKTWPYVFRASVHKMRGDSARALKDFTAALRGSSPAPWIRLERAALLEERGAFGRALEDVERTLKSSGDDARLLLRRARLKTLRGGAASTASDVRKALRLGARAGEIRDLIFGLAGDLRAAGREAEAGRVLGSAAERFPKDADLLLARGEARDPAGSVKDVRDLLRRDRLDEAEGLVRKLLSQGIAGADCWGALAEIHILRGRLREAADAYRAATAAEPGHLETALGLSETLWRLGEPRQALAALKRFGGASPSAKTAGGPAVLLEEFRLAVATFDFRRAEKAGESLLDATRRYEHIHAICSPFFRADFDFMKQAPAYGRRAAAALERFLAARPRSPWGYFYRDRLSAVMGARSEARQADVDRFTAAPEERYGWMRCQAGEYYLLQRMDFGAALKNFRIAARSTAPGDWTAQCLAGETLMCLGRTREALEAVDAARSLVPPNRLGEVLAWKGELLLWSGRYREALSVLDRALALGARFAHGWRGGALVKLGRHAEALASLDTAVALLPHDAESRGWKAEALLLSGKCEASLREAEKAEDGYQGYCSFHLEAVRGLACRETGDAAGVRRALCRMPSRVLDYVVKKRALSADDPGVLRAVLELSRGVRRGNHETAVWMR